MTGTLKRVLNAQQRTKPMPKQGITIVARSESKTSNVMLREKLERDVAEYLKKGGKVEQVPIGQTKWSDE
jgi:mannose/fructose/N-acetylgalactosamine-specific phosphotransferase system component IIB